MRPGSWTTMPPVVIAANHSRTYRSLKLEAAAISSEAGSRHRSHCCEQPHLVAHADHQSEHSVVENLDEAGEGGGFVGRSSPHRHGTIVLARAGRGPAHETRP